MNGKTLKAMFDLVKEEIFGKDEKIVYPDFTDEDYKDLYLLSKKHDVAHLVGDALIKKGLISNGEIKDKFSKEIFTAVYRYENLNHALSEMKQAFDEEKLSYVPLKGSVIRGYYPEPWMRTSCDVDVLIKEEDVERASKVLSEKLGYEESGKGSHDVSFTTKSKMHLELHYCLVENYFANTACEVLKSVWSDIENVNATGGGLKTMSNEMFYFYHVAHMAKHFEHGGCGIRPFLDMKILKGKMRFDETKLSELLERGNLSVFAKQAERLSEAWFGNSEHTDVTERMQDYVLRGGVYGTNENRIVVQQQKKGGRFKYACSKIFLSYEILKYQYPILQKHKWLTPFMEVRRWFKLVFCGHAKRTLKELKYNDGVSAEEAQAAQQFLKDVGLQ